MLSYTIRRVLLMIPTLLAVATLIFVLLRIVPGDIVALKLTADGGQVTDKMIELERQRLGLEAPLWQQYIDWMAGLVTLDFGNSLWTQRPVATEIGIRFWTSFEVAILATVIAVTIALPLGTIAALYRGTTVDYVVRIITIGGLAVPSFWFGMLIILGLLAWFQWLPPLTQTPFFEDPAANLSQLIWPALAVGYRYSAVTARMLRSSILEVLSEDYIRTARAKGVYERLVILRHGVRNALLPTITVIGLEFAFLIGGLVVTEQVFNLNGIGKLFVDSVIRNDYTMVQGLVMVVATSFVIVNLIVDLIYAALDPRIRYQA